MDGTLFVGLLLIFICRFDGVLTHAACDWQNEDECNHCKPFYPIKDTASVKCEHLCPIGVPLIECNKICSYFCRLNSNKLERDIIGCVKGWHGKICDKTCSKDCLNYTCNRNGSCHECQLGLYGPFCNRSCDHCIDKRCHMNGKCYKSCYLNYYGDNCTKLCNTACRGGIGLSGDLRRCSHAIGNCMNGCIDGWFGARCETKCSKDCKDNFCHVENGMCLNGCTDGKYGRLCNQICNSNCSGLKCNQHTGACTDGCTDFTFGNHCNRTCSYRCINSLCEGSIENVTCTKGCLEGWWGPYCQKQCPDNCQICQKTTGICINCENHRYGSNCSGTCSEGCVGQDCDMTGVCRQGCVHGWTGPKCQLSILWLVVPGLAAAVILAICVVVLLCSRQRKCIQSERTNTYKLDMTPSYLAGHIQPEGDSTTALSENRRPANDMLENIKFDQKSVNRVSLEDFGRYVSSIKMTGEMDRQFNRLPVNPVYPCYDGELPKVARKNRYGNILPYDYNRVVVNNDTDNPSTDYINASYINGYNQSKSFIATQGPFSEVIGNFWTMVWQKNVGIIVMLTNCVERNMVKCEQYWPNMRQAQLITPNIIVECSAETVEQDVTTRIFKVTKEGHVAREIKQFHFTAWPDSDVPDNSMSLLHLNVAVTSSTPLDAGPVVVHCSAGVGRTGTYIALDYLIQQAKAEGELDVFDCVLRLRHQRMNLVQTEDQYSLIHDVLLQAVQLLEENGGCTTPFVNLHVDTEESTV